MSDRRSCVCLLRFHPEARRWLTKCVWRTRCIEQQKKLICNFTPTEYKSFSKAFCLCLPPSVPVFLLSLPHTHLYSVSFCMQINLSLTQLLPSRQAQSLPFHNQTSMNLLACCLWFLNRRTCLSLYEFYLDSPQLMHELPQLSSFTDNTFCSYLLPCIKYCSKPLETFDVYPDFDASFRVSANLEFHDQWWSPFLA